MTESTSKILIGTSGFSYPHWKRNFYPAGLNPKLWLNYYSQIFPTVELNTTFYHLPLISTIKNWHAQVPENFLFSIKASSYITHRKKLNDCKENVHYFYKRIHGLKAKTGPILFQLPPSFKANKERLSEFITYLKKPFLHVLEFRHDSWFTDEIYDILKENNIGLCITDITGKMSPEEITSDFTYIRLHGPKIAYQGSYGPMIKGVKKKILKWSEKASVFCYFDNDEKAFATQDAKKLQVML